MNHQFNTQLTDLSPEQKKEAENYMKWEAQNGNEKPENAVSHLPRFFQYVNDLRLDLFALSMREAQGFQTWLVSLETESGKPHYATLTVKTIVSQTVRFYRYLQKSGKVAHNPFHTIKRMKNERRLPQSIPDETRMNDMLEKLRRFWTYPEVRAQRQYYKAHVMAELMYATGLRISEVLSLTEDNIDFENQTILIRGKGGKERRCYLTTFAASVLKVYVHEMKDVINVNKNEKNIFGVADRSTVSTVFHRYLKEACKDAGIGRFTAHAFRHTLGFHLLRRGCDMRYIQLILGHEALNTTAIYTKVDKGDLKKELDRFHPRHIGLNEKAV